MTMNVQGRLNMTAVTVAERQARNIRLLVTASAYYILRHCRTVHDRQVIIDIIGKTGSAPAVPAFVCPCTVFMYRCPCNVWAV